MPTNDTENIYSTEFENDPTPIPSSKIGYDNTESGLEATTVQGAIDELDSKIKASDEASEITYDNTESGLEAENVQDAIDEILNIETTHYKLTGKPKTIAATSEDGGNKDAANKLVAALNTLLATLDDDTLIEPIILDMTDSGLNTMRASFGKSMLAKNDSVTTLEGYSILTNAAGTTVTVRFARISATDCVLSHANIASGTTAIVDDLTTTGSATAHLIYKEYKK